MESEDRADVIGNLKKKSTVCVVIVSLMTVAILFFFFILYFVQLPTQQNADYYEVDKSIMRQETIK